MPDGPVLQAAYGVLDKYRISRTFFVTTDQNDCETKGEAEEVEDEQPSSAYDIVVDDGTVADELFVNHYGQIPATHYDNNVYYQRNANATAESNANATSNTANPTTTTAAETAKQPIEAKKE